ncbi:hypothetical protein [Wenzhouxiangella marina]|uniref:hypothetical protein n=1 Tax=Wenzhouxiangella marina TaxID=1579979 RepID=UPI00067337A3|nr:hypothetical protein [Wenzhouxiangella marina]MBB6088662.1 hypothetical protein [Wenzhouxiangella marina]
MSHAIDFDGLHEKLFLLRHLSLGSEAYCRQEGIGSDADIGEGEADAYWGWLKALLGNYLIECAVKLRMIQEFCTASGFEEELVNFERSALEGLELGLIHEGDFALSVRETTNKIIHATRATIDFVPTVDTPAFRHWDGYYHLYGKKGTHNWHLSLAVYSWSKAVSAYLDELQFSELTLYMGQDWA